MATDTDVELTIEALGGRGDGIATWAGERVYVPYAVPGDRLRLRLARDKDERLTGRIRAVLASGPDRARPVCPHFGTCGGCAVQHLGAEAYRAIKRRRIEAALARHGIVPETIEPIAASPPGSRRRVEFAAMRKRDGVTLGFNERASHRLVDVTECPVLRPALAAALPAWRAVLAELLKPAESADVHLTATDSGIDALLATAADFKGPARQRLADFAAERDFARLSLRHPRAGTEPLAIRRPVRVDFGGVPVPWPAGAFLQATAEGEAALAGFVRRALAGARRIADLYSGAGTFALPLAKAGARIHAVDASRPMVEALLAGARAAGLAGVSAETRDLDKRPLPPEALAGCDGAIFDPPRAGAARQAAELAHSAVPVIVAVSCNAATFARDAAALIAGGYRPVRLLPVDQFLWSPHLELAAEFRR